MVGGGFSGKLGQLSLLVLKELCGHDNSFRNPEIIVCCVSKKTLARLFC